MDRIHKTHNVVSSSPMLFYTVELCAADTVLFLTLAVVDFVLLDNIGPSRNVGFKFRKTSFAVERNFLSRTLYTSTLIKLLQT